MADTLLCGGRATHAAKSELQEVCRDSVEILRCSSDRRTCAFARFGFTTYAGLSLMKRRT
jgi:hypothetical protein